MIQKELIEWAKVFDAAIIEEAIRLTVIKGGRSFSYTEKILQGWEKAGLKTFDDVQTYELGKELEKSRKVISFRRKTREEKNSGDLFAGLLGEDF